MKISTALVSSVFAVTVLAAGSALAAKVDAVNNEGRQIVVGGQEWAISNSGTQVTIKGQAAKRDQIQAGMDCDVQGADGKATTVSCK